MTPEILGFGEPLIEMVRLPDDIDGRPTYVQGFGGDSSTATIAAARQGGKAGYISAVGGDMFGDALRGLWTREGVDHSHVLTRDGAPTGICFINPDPAARSFTYARTGSAASRFEASEVPLAAIAEARILHLSGITLAVSGTMRAAGFAAMRMAKDGGTLVSLDINNRPALWDGDLARATLEDAAQLADIVFVSDDEAELLFGDRTQEAVADRFLGLGAGIVVAKAGAKGALLAVGELRVPVPPAPSRPVDSSGAGDSFAGTFLAWYVETGDAVLAARKGAEIAAATVSGYGAVEPIPRRGGRN